MIVFLHDLNIGLDIKQLKAQINKFEKSAEAPADGVVTFEVFTEFFEKLAVRREIAELIQKYKEEGDEEGTLGIEGLRKLLTKELGYDGTSSDHNVFLSLFFSPLKHSLSPSDVIQRTNLLPSHVRC